MNTILYMKDIAEKHPYIDYNTKNQSFLRIALVLKRMGIRNYYFFLSLYDRTLLGVDPFGNFFCIQDDGVIFFDHETNGIEVLTKSFDDFLASLHI